MATTLNSADKSASITLSNGDLTFESTGAAVTYFCVRSIAQAAATQKVYFELLINRATSGQTALGVGMGNSTASLSAFPGNDTNSFGYYSDTGEVFFNGVVTGTAAAATGGAIVRFAWDEANKRLWVAVNGSAWNNGTTADPVAGTGSIGIATLAGASGTHYVIATSANPSGADKGTLNFSPSSWVFPAPEGFGAMGGTQITEAVSESIATADTIGATANSLSQAWQPNAFEFFPQAVGGGGTTYTDAVDETIATADTQTAVTVRLGAIAETIATADTQTAVLVAVGSQAESIATADTQTAILVGVASVAESIATADTQSTAMVAVGTVAETSAASDTVSTALVAPVAIAESIATADTQSATTTISAAVAESIATADTQTSVLVAVASVAESAAASDTQTAVSVRVGAVAETVAIADTTDWSTGNIYTDSVSETIATADTQSAVLLTFGTVAETLGVADTQDATGGTVPQTGLPFGLGGGRAYSRRRMLEILAEIRAEDEVTAREAREAEQQALSTLRKAEAQFEREVTADPVAMAEKALPRSSKASRIVTALRQAMTAQTQRADRMEEALAGAAAMIEDMEDELEALVALLLSRAA